MTKHHAVLRGHNVEIRRADTGAVEWDLAYGGQAVVAGFSLEPLTDQQILDRLLDRLREWHASRTALAAGNVRQRQRGVAR